MFFLYIFSLAFAVFAAWAYGRATDRVIAETNLETERLKKENLQLRNDLSAEAGKVAGLQKAATDAQRDLSEQKGKTAALETAADEAKAELAEQQGRTATLEKAADDARARVEELKAENLKTELTLEEEKTTRLELEKSLAPRAIPIILPPGRVPASIADGARIMIRPGPSIFDPLKRVTGQKVVVQFLPDSESRRAARELLRAFEVVGWEVISVIANTELEHPYFDDVVIETPAPTAESREDIQKYWRESAQLRESAIVLLKFLNANNWKARVGASGSNIPPNTLRVSIGFKSPPSNNDFLSPKTPIQPERTSPRHIADFQRDIISKRLSDFRLARVTNPVPVEVRCPAENNEACAFAEEILSVLKDQKWPVSGDAVIRDANFPRRLSGLVVRDPLNDTWPMASLLYQAFLYGSLTPLLDRQPDAGKSDPVQIMVGW